MNILFTVCGRAGSKGFKNKNLQNLLDIPLVYYTLGVILEYKNLHKNYHIDTVVSSDSEELHKLVQSQRMLVVDSNFRDGYLAGDTAPKVSVILSCLEFMELRKNLKYDLVVDLDITSPLRTLDDLDNAIEKKIMNINMDCVFSVTKARRNPYFNMVKVKNEIASIVIEGEYTTRQGAPDVFDMNASIYVYNPSSLKTKSPVGFFNNNCSISLMKDTAVLDIDHEDDLNIMEVLFAYYVRNNQQFKAMYDSAFKILESARNVE